MTSKEWYIDAKEEERSREREREARENRKVCLDVDWLVACSHRL